MISWALACSGHSGWDSLVTAVPSRVPAGHHTAPSAVRPREHGCRLRERRGEEVAPGAVGGHLEREPNRCCR